MSNLSLTLVWVAEESSLSITSPNCFCCCKEVKDISGIKITGSLVYNSLHSYCLVVVAVAMTVPVPSPELILYFY